MYRSFVFQNFCLGRQQVYLITEYYEVEDESHMLFKCPIYETERATLLIYIQDNCKNFEHLSPNNKLIWLLSSEDTLI
jgi:hypothetical protein